MLTYLASALMIATRTRLPGSPPNPWDSRFLPPQLMRETEEDRLYRDWLRNRR